MKYLLLLGCAVATLAELLESSPVLTGGLTVSANGSYASVIQGVRVLSASVNSSVEYTLPRAALTATRQTMRDDAASLPAGFGTGVSFKVRVGSREGRRELLTLRFSESSPSSVVDAGLCSLAPPLPARPLGPSLLCPPTSLTYPPSQLVDRRGETVPLGLVGMQLDEAGKPEFIVELAGKVAAPLLSLSSSGVLSVNDIVVSGGLSVFATMSGLIAGVTALAILNVVTLCVLMNTASPNPPPASEKGKALARV